MLQQVLWEYHIHIIIIPAYMRRRVIDTTLTPRFELDFHTLTKPIPNENDKSLYG